MGIAEHILSEHDIKVTANRILILRALMDAERPLSLSDIETELETVDKSIISRTLATFRAHHLVHQILSGDEAKYEFCHNHACHDHDEFDDDEHVHFYCEKCHKTYCLEDLSIPQVDFPEGYEVSEINYVASGICPDCARKQH